MIVVLTAKDIKESFRVDPVEFTEYRDLGFEYTEESVAVLEDLVYRRKLRESHRNFRDSLYDSIKANWIQTPIDLSYNNKIILDGLHRIASAYDIDKYRLLPVNYID
jgi:hypothetical protein